MAESTSSNLPATQSTTSVAEGQEKKTKWWLHRSRGEDRETLLPWHTVAIIRTHLFGETKKAVCEEFSKSETTLRQVERSPAGQRLIAYLDEEISDPVEFAKEIVKANTLGATLDRYLALEWAKRDKDAALVDKIARDLQEKGGIVAERKGDAAREGLATQVMHFHFDKGTSIQDVLNAPVIKAEYELVEDAEDDE